MNPVCFHVKTNRAYKCLSLNIRDLCYLQKISTKLSRSLSRR